MDPFPNEMVLFLVKEIFTHVMCLFCHVLILSRLVGLFVLLKRFPIKGMSEMFPDSEPGAAPISIPTDG